MDDRSAKPSARRRAFTLLELMIVIVIIAILAGISYGVISALRARTLRGLTTVEIQTLGANLDLHRNQLGAYPPDDITLVGGSAENGTSEALVYYLRRKLKKGGNTYGPYMEFKKARLEDRDGDGFPEYSDPYGNPYVYADNASEATPTGMRPRSYDLASPGPDGELGGTISPATGYVPAASPAGKAQEKDNITSWGG